MATVALTIAGSDPSGGAGIQADLKTFHAHSAFGTSVITLLTVQNTRGVERVKILSPDLVRDQLRAVLSDLPPGAAKTGALGSESIINVLSEEARSFTFPLILDPVMVSKHGAPLMEESAQIAFRTRLLPCAFLVTPNVPEAEVLAARPIRSLADAEDAGKKIVDFGAKHALIKGGHGDGPEATDVLVSHDGMIERFSGLRLQSRNTHGTGCTLSAAITARLARGEPLQEAVRGAKQFVADAIRSAPELGSGCGPVNFFAPVPHKP